MGEPDQHRDAAVLLRARRRAAGRRGDRADQGSRSRRRTVERGRAIVERNFAAIDAALAGAAARRRPVGGDESTTTRLDPIPDDAPEFVQPVTAALIAGDGDLLPVSALPVDGTFPTGTATYEKRAIAKRDPDLGSRRVHRLRQVRDRLPARHDPHEGVRRRASWRARPAGSVPRRSARKDIAGPPADDPGRTRRLHRLRRVRRRVPGEGQVRGAAQGDQHGAGRSTHRDVERARWDYFLTIPQLDRDAARPTTR